MCTRLSLSAGENPSPYCATSSTSCTRSEGPGAIRAARSPTMRSWWGRTEPASESSRRSSNKSRAWWLQRGRRQLLHLLSRRAALPPPTFRRTALPPPTFRRSSRSCRCSCRVSLTKGFGAPPRRCTLPTAMSEITDDACRHPPGTFVPRIDTALCEGKAVCAAVCPYGVFDIRKLTGPERRAL